MSNPIHLPKDPKSEPVRPSQFFGDSVFWIEIEKIKPNPYQPRREFEDTKLNDLAESIRMYGILQPLVVTRKEVYREDGGLTVEYELISGERRLRASKIAGLQQVPALIRSGEDDAKMKLELAIIENLQREDLNAVDRARAFERLANEFGMKHGQIAEKVGKSREYVSNTLRILALPEEILNAVSEGKISEGHTRPLLMLIDRPEEQATLFKEVLIKKITVREAEAIARKIAHDRTRKKDKSMDPEIIELERTLKESLGTRVRIVPGETGGKITIDFFSPEDLKVLIENLQSGKSSTNITETMDQDGKPLDDRAPEDVEKEDNSEDLYTVKNFVV
jgi:ParB family chromosome partitioning protein